MVLEVFPPLFWSSDHIILLGKLNHFLKKNVEQIFSIIYLYTRVKILTLNAYGNKI